MQPSTRYDIETLPFYDDTLDYDVYEVPHTVYSDGRPASWDPEENRPYTTVGYYKELPFYADTENRSEFTSKTAIRRAVTPEYGTYYKREELPFYSETTNRADYIYKEPIPPFRRPSPMQREQIPFYGQTTNRETYTPKEVISKPATKVDESRMKIAFHDTTTYKEVHAPIEIKKQHPRPQQAERLQLPPLDSQTTNRAVYTPKRSERTVGKATTSLVGERLPMDTLTTTQLEYTPKKAERKVARRVRSARRDLPPLDGETTTQADYTRKQGGRAKPTRTRDHDLFPGRFDGQRRLQDAPQLHHCPAEKLSNYTSTQARFVGGHWWFRGGTKRSKSALNSPSKGHEK